VSSEGLDSFLTTAARDAVRLADDASRLRLLAAWGTDYVILDRPLDPAAEGLVDRASRLPSFDGSVDLWRIRDAAPAVLAATTTVRAASLNEAVARLADPAFDPRRMVVLPGPASDAPRGAPTGAPPAKIEVVESDPERLAFDVDAGGPAVVVIQRALQPIDRASVDGTRVAPRIANLHRIGIEVPAGRHRVELWVDRMPLRTSLLVSLAGILGLSVAALRARREAPVTAPDSAAPRPAS